MLTVDVGFLYLKLELASGIATESQKAETEKPS